MADKFEEIDLISEHSGEYYAKILSNIHTFLSPKTYLEIGTQTGGSLATSRCKSIAIDPNFQISQPIMAGKSICHLMQMSSDEFFSSCNPENLLGDKVDFVFLDGMHWFEYLLRDFMNIEKYCKRNSVVAIHDCIPTDVHIARRDPSDDKHRAKSRNPDWWAGDVWKAIAVLKVARPDLSIRAFDAPPTGLIIITNLNPANRELDDRYFDLIDSPFTRDEGLPDFIRSLGLQSTAAIDSHGKMSGYYWL